MKFCRFAGRLVDKSADAAGNVKADPIHIHDRLELKVTSDPANLASVRKSVEGIAAAAGFSDKDVGDVGLCVNEAMANIIRHAYDGMIDRPIHISASVEANALSIAIRDWGKGVDPTQLPPRPHDPRQPGGVGLICLSQWMDEVTFTPQPDGMLTTLVKRLKHQ